MTRRSHRDTRGRPPRRGSAYVLVLVTALVVAAFGFLVLLAIYLPLFRIALIGTGTN